MTSPTPERAPVEFQFPTQAELAQLAASLNLPPTTDPEARVKEALRLRFHSWIACNHFGGLSPADIISQLDAPELHEWTVDGLIVRDCLRLYPDNARISEDERSKFFKGALDPARAYLQSKVGWADWKTARTVLHAFRIRFLDAAHQYNKENNELIKLFEVVDKKRAEQGGVTMRLPGNGTLQVRRDGLEDYRTFLAKCAVNTPATSLEHIGNEPGKRPRVLYWNIPIPNLDHLAWWRGDVKKRGGMKKVEKDALAALPKAVREKVKAQLEVD